MSTDDDCFGVRRRLPPNANLADAYGVWCAACLRYIDRREDLEYHQFGKDLRDGAALGLSQDGGRDDWSVLASRTTRHHGPGPRPILLTGRPACI